MAVTLQLKVECATRRPGATMKNNTSSRLFAYWNEIRGPRMAPHRFEIEPSRISDILAQTFILERDAENTFRFRLAGTQICDHFGREFRGHNILELWHEDDRINFDRVLRGASFEGAVGVVALEAHTANDKSATFEMLLLPLVHSGSAITRLLGAISPDEDAPSWLGTTAVVRQRIKRISMIWPDGRPHSILQKSEKQLPFSKGPAHKRVVSSNRRNFRVFDGGRSNGPQPSKPAADGTDAQ